MKKFKLSKLVLIALSLMMMLTACGNQNDANNSNGGQGSTVDITDVHGVVSVPINPKRVVALDNRTFETLSDWKIELKAAPKDVMPSDSTYVLDESVQNIGNHREPNLEIIAAVNPDLVIVGQRFASYYDQIKELVPNAAVVDFSFDVSKDAATPGKNLVNGLKDSTIALGKIFSKELEANKLVSDFDDAIESVNKAYNGTDTVMGVIVSGGNIGYAAPGSGRVWGPMFEIFNWKPALDVDNSTSDHQGDDISVEAIAQSNPQWVFVLDRDAATSDASQAVPAQDVINNAPALQNIDAIKANHVVYAPKDTYTNESIQTYLELFNNLAKALAE
ncbi:iron ABC transporter substrate-binding protein [Erysipelothrix larvae]|uniref:Iron ABC transporter substrate-binding protein n=1 Tax=Erysipelothrix larvae TaxID=1514105 RepID=A0A0X8H1Y4_9FIRM|nr:ABC transporter substrate-binding protein [Erysipelothrix larvae]AMC94364.1 iron ABC transporter substrate-binding protein [Erysipelothrix larvae]